MSDEQGFVLVVDDNEMNRDMLSRRLQRQGYEVMVAENGAQALEMMRAHRFDLVLLDIMMPQINGYEVLEQVKNDPGLRELPIIMISAVDELDSVVKCIELGAEDYLFKPFNPVLLKARVGASLEKKRLRDRTTGQVLVSLSHELNAPLSSALSNANQLLSGQFGPLTPQQAQTLRDIIANLNLIASRLNG